MSPIAYTTDRTWVTGEIVTAAYFNTYLRDNMKWLSTDKPMCSVYKSTAFSHNSTGNSLPITFDSERFDNATLHSTSSDTTRITIPVAGKYLIGGTVEFAVHATGYRALGVRIDGATFIVAHNEITSSVTVNTQIAVSRFYALSVNAYAELLATQNSGGNLDIGSTAAYTPEFWAIWLGI